MSPNAWPAMVPFDPDDGSFPSALEALFARPAATIPAVLLIAGETARRDGWAERTAIAIAEGWAQRRGDPVVLADLVAEPRLVELAGEEGAEGIADVLEFGLSLRRVTRTLDEHQFRLIPAGPYLPVATGLFEHPRWGRLIAQFAEEQSTLLAYAAMDSSGLDTLARRIGTAIILAGPTEASRIAATLPANCSIVLALQQPDDFAAALRAAAQDAGVEATDLLDPDPLDDDLDIDAAEVAPTMPADDELTEEVDADVEDAGHDDIEADPLLGEPSFIRRAQPRRRTSPLAWLALVAGLAAGGWFAAQYVLEEWGEPDPTVAGAVDPQTSPTPADSDASTEPSEPVETPAPFSIALEAHPDASSAIERVRSLRGADPAIGFFMTPVVVDDAIYYRVMAGPAADSVSAVALLHRLVQRGHKSDADDWAVRPTAWAYHLGDYDSPGDAAARVDTLAEHGIPAYTLEIPFTTGPDRHRVYAGAYEALTQAEIMGELLERAEIEAPLVRRTGRSVEQ